MHFTLKLTQIGNSVGGVLPKEALAALKVEKGDSNTAGWPDCAAKVCWIPPLPGH